MLAKHILHQPGANSFTPALGLNGRSQDLDRLGGSSVDDCEASDFVAVVDYPSRMATEV